MPESTLPGIRNSAFSLFFIFAVLSIFLRFFSFFPSVIDHDESTYLEIARMLLAGKTLYVDMIDIKPPGIFLILAGFQFVFGYSIFVIRLLVAFWIALTGWMIYKTGKHLLKDERSSVAAGVIYIFFISTWSFYGISITTEIFFNLFTITSLYILLKSNNTWKYFLAGILAGFGFMVKYFVVFDFAVFVVFSVFILDRHQKNIPIPFRVIISVLLAGAGFLIPFATANIVYYLNGHFGNFYNIIYQAPTRYPSECNAWGMLKFILDFHLRFLPVFIFFYIALLNRRPKVNEAAHLRLFMTAWSFMALLAVLISGKTFGHYTIQMMLPVSLMAGVFFHPEAGLPVYFGRLLSKRAGLVILAVLIILISALKLEYVFHRDIPREIASYLKPKLQEADVIYTGNYHHIVYYLLKKESPTPYIHRSLLYDQDHIEALNIDTGAEFERIMQKRPVYIITKDVFPDGVMKDFIMNYYSVEKDFGKGIRLHRLKD
ncbi:MAG: glycosyltransferase family 39 protein [Bacteroidales bacterium]|nr:glycosyltransferase family 39 protein [Bacteroidales bacterium]